MINFTARIVATGKEVQHSIDIPGSLTNYSKVRSHLRALTEKGIINRDEVGMDSGTLEREEFYTKEWWKDK